MVSFRASVRPTGLFWRTAAYFDAGLFGGCPQPPWAGSYEAGISTLTFRWPWPPKKVVTTKNETRMREPWLGRIDSTESPEPKNAIFYLDLWPRARWRHFKVGIICLFVPSSRTASSFDAEPFGGYATWSLAFFYEVTISPLTFVWPWPKVGREPKKWNSHTDIAIRQDGQYWLSQMQKYNFWPWPLTSGTVAPPQSRIICSIVAREP